MASEYAELDEFEVIILGYALAYGKVESGNVSTQLQQTLKEKGQTATSYFEVFDRTVARLQKRGLLDDRKTPTAHASEVVPPQILRNSLLMAHKRINELDEQGKNKDSEISQLRNRIYGLENDLRNAQGKINKLSPPTEIISKDRLDQGLGHFLGWEILSKISEEAKSDLEDAIKSIYHGIPTAAAMVSLRASEDAVRKYYEFKSGQVAGKTSWKGILDQLMQRDDVNTTLIGHLHYIREKRNEAEHPGKVFKQKEAENTFLTVINMIEEIYKEMK